MSKVAVLVIDLLNDFVRGRLKVPGAEELLSRARRLIDEARGRGVPVIYVCDSHLPGVDRELELWGPHALRGTWGSAIADEVAPRDGDYVVYKRRYSAFYATELDLLLRELGVDTLMLVGVATDICVQHTAADAFYRGYKLIVVEDCVASVTREAHERGLEAMRRLYAAEVVGLEEALRRLSA